MPITKSGTRITIQWVSGDTKGYSWATAWTLDDIVAASVAGGWGPAVTKVENVYTIPYSVYIEGSTTYIAWNVNLSEQGYIVLFTATAPVDANQINVLTSANLKFGGRGTLGSSDVIYPLTLICGTVMSASSRRLNIGAAGENYVNNVSFYGWYYMYFYGTSTWHFKGTNLSCYKIQYGITANDYTELENVSLYGGYYGMTILGQNNQMTLKNIFIYQHTIGILMSGVMQGEVVGIKMQYNINWDTYMRCAIAADKKIYMVDCQVDQTKLNFYNSGTYALDNRNEQFLQTTMSFYITDEAGDPVDGANIKLYDVEDNLLLDVDTVNGETLNHKITYFSKWRICQGVTGITLEEDEYDRQPMYATVEKDGFDILSFLDINVVAGEPTILRGVLVETTPPIYVDRALDGEVDTVDVDGSVDVLDITGEVTFVELEAVL